MEGKLKEFKSRRRKELLFQKPKDFFNGIVEKLSPKKMSKEAEKKPLNDTSYDDGNESSLLLNTLEEEPSKPLSYLTILTYVLYFALWVVTYLIAIQLEFGFVYLVISGLLFIYFNTRTGPKRKGEISAYSVFNPGCKSIQGTLKAEDLERQFNIIQHK